MEKKIIYRMSSPYRDEFRISGYEFGEGEKTVAIIGAMRGDEIQQQYVCAQIVKRLMKIENDGKIDKGCKILVIPNANPFSMNLEKRFCGFYQLSDKFLHGWAFLQQLHLPL